MPQMKTKTSNWRLSNCCEWCLESLIALRFFLSVDFFLSNPPSPYSRLTYSIYVWVWLVSSADWIVDSMASIDRYLCITFFGQQTLHNDAFGSIRHKSCEREHTNRSKWKPIENEWGEGEKLIYVRYLRSEDIIRRGWTGNNNARLWRSNWNIYHI